MAFKDKTYDCWARINGKDYPIAYGFPITDEFSETLDSSTIILPHVRGLLDIKPYDDVIIHDFGIDGLPPRPFGKRIRTDSDEQPEFKGHFYRHFLIVNPYHEIVSFEKTQTAEEKVAYDSAISTIQETINDQHLSDEEKRKIVKSCLKTIEETKPQYWYNYTLELASETKGLETVQLPNKTITQRINVEEYFNKENLGPSFAFSEGTFTLPYALANSPSDGLEMFKTYVITNTITGYLYAGDNNSETSDFMSFSKFPKAASPRQKISLPDWSISSVSATEINRTIFGIIAEEKTTVYNAPYKHWIIRKIGINDNRWQTRQQIIDNIKSYISGNFFSFPEITNYDFIGGTKYDIWSQEGVSSIQVEFPDVTSGAAYDDYVIYLYVEKQIHEFEHTLVRAPFNVFGMTKNREKPTDTSEFLAMWTTRCSSTQAIDAHDATTVYEAVRQAVEIYSPYVKVTTDGNTWEYRRKYSIDQETKALFNKVIAPENQWNSPNLRDFITRLFYVGDCIPVVRDGVIGHMNLSQRNGEFYADENKMSYEGWSMDGGSYCDRVLRNYTDGLSKDNLVKCVERVGFKNSDSPTLTLENLRLELAHPIYRVNKVYMCYYNQYTKGGQKYMRLCKQDITPLVLLNSQRNLLSENWSSVDDLTKNPTSIEELAQYKYATIGYDIGSRYISGWGGKYSYPKWLFWTATRTVIENIYDFMSKTNPLGVYNPLEDDFGGYSQSEDGVFSSNASENREAIVPTGNAEEPYVAQLISSESLIQNEVYKNLFSNFTQRIKSLMFIVEYEGYISSAVIASKDFHDGNVVSRDNASSSLSFVESDGVNQKEKVNRLGNPSITISARYVDYDDVQNMASVWNDENSEWISTKHKDDVMFKRTVAFFKDYVLVSYYFCRNYVLRNYFTSVFSKHRPFALASYAESVERQENRTLEVLFSSKKAFWQNESKKVNFYHAVDKLLSFYTPSKYDSKGNIIINEGIDSSYYVVYPSKNYLYKGQTGIFATDIQKFTSGNSLCFNISMTDNVSAGVFSSNLNHNVGLFIGETITSTLSIMFRGKWDVTTEMAMASNLLTGAKQDWYMFPVDPNTGMLYSMSFGIGFLEGDIYGVNSMQGYKLYDIAAAQLLPLMDVVLKQGEDHLYFGQIVDDKAVGLGYPRISFTKQGNENKYMVDFTSKDYAYTYDQCVIDYEPLAFANADGDDLPTRNKVVEFASAKFVGHETEYSDETDTCVFKDGKERIVSTIQFEPINDDESIMFSSYMMKLSDAMGGLEKNYNENKIVSEMKILFGCSTIIIKSDVFQGGGGSRSYQHIFSVPTMTIAIPHGASNVDGIAINKTFSINGIGSDENPIVYKVIVNSITRLDVTNEIMYVDCSIVFNGNTVYNGDIQMYLISANPVINGRTNQSDFSAASTCIDAGLDYDSYAFCEDAFFYFRTDSIIDDRHYCYFKQSELNQGIAATDNYPFYSNVPNSLCLLALQGAADFTPEDAVMSARNYNYKNSRVRYASMSGANVSWSLSILGFNVSVVTEGPSVDETLVKRRNMFWCIDVPMNKETPYTTLTDEPPNLVDVGVNIGKSEKGIDQFTVNFDYEIETKSSLRLYYMTDDGTYHFVFGMNIAPSLGSSDVYGELPNFNYPWAKAGPTYYYGFYVSFLDDRSKKVINDIAGDERQGETTYKVANYADDEETPSDSTIVYPFNKCVEK